MISSEETVLLEKNEQNSTQLMKTKVTKGNKETNNFSQVVWSHIIQGLEVTTKKLYKHELLGNIFNTLRARWRDWSSLPKETRISCNVIIG